jgi:helix-turn-helix protein
METERMELSARERERSKVLHEVEQGHLRQVEAAHRLRLSDRQVRRLLGRLGTAGDGGLVHGLRGRTSNSLRGFRSYAGRRASGAAGAGIRR